MALASRVGLDVLQDPSGSVEGPSGRITRAKVAIVIQIKALGQEFDVDALSCHGFEEGRHHAGVIRNRQDHLSETGRPLHDPTDLNVVFESCPSCATDSKQ